MTIGIKEVVIFAVGFAAGVYWLHNYDKKTKAEVETDN